MDQERELKIGIFRALYLGDMLCIIPAVRAIRHAFPNATIILIGLPWEKFFARRFAAYFDDFASFPGWPGLPEQELDQEKIVHFLHHIRQQKFDLLFQMQGNGSVTNRMCLLWGANTVVGLRRNNDFCLDQELFPVSEDTDHEVLRFFKLTSALEIPSAGTDLEFPFLSEEIVTFDSVKNRLHLPRRYVCIHAGARDVRRRWPIEKFAFVARQLIDQEHKVVLTGSPEERSLLNDLEEKIGKPVINTMRLLDDLSLGHLAMIIRDSRLLISNDTGVSHIAAALKVPSVIVFSEFSDPKRWAPLNTTLHRVVTPDRSQQPEVVLQYALEQLRALKEPSPLLFDHK